MLHRSPAEAEALGLLGLAMRAGMVMRGVDATRRGVNSNEVRLVLFARDASETQLGKVKGLLQHRDIPVRWVSGRDALGRALGEGPLAAVGIKGSSFATRLLERLPQDPSDPPKDGRSHGGQEERRKHAGR